MLAFGGHVFSFVSQVIGTPNGLALRYPIYPLGGALLDDIDQHIQNAPGFNRFDHETRKGIVSPANSAETAGQRNRSL